MTFAKLKSDPKTLVLNSDDGGVVEVEGLDYRIVVERQKRLVIEEPKQNERRDWSEPMDDYD